MTEFVIIASERMTFRGNDFIEVARKKAVDGKRETEFLCISRGIDLADGSSQFRKVVTFPDDPKLKEFIIDNLKKI